MSSFKLLVEHTIDEHADSLAAYLPNDCTFEAKHVDGTVVRSFLLGLAPQLKRFEDVINLMTTEFGPDCAFQLLPEWERMLGIPDDCFSNTESTENRQNNALVKLAKMSAQTATEMEEVAFLLGFSVTVLSGYDAIRPPYNLVIPEINNDQEAKFTIVVLYDENDSQNQVFPLEFPIVFGAENFGNMQCVLQKIKPANCQMVFYPI